MDFLLLIAPLLIAQVSAQTQPSCDSKIYCQGNLLHTVQLARINDDSKAFVDMKIKNDENTTLANFEEFFKQTNGNPSRDEVKAFVNDNFESYDEFEVWTPADYTENPKLISKIDDEEVKVFTQELVKIWPKLAKKMKKEVLESPEYFTLLPVPNGFVIPGGRFKEFYYWDSYWIIEGLLLSDMEKTVQGMLDNFLSIVDKYGFVPNGARIYYLNRSQPPLLNRMVSIYMKATNDKEWLRANIKTLDKELRFWLQNKLVEVVKDGSKYTLAHYDSESGSPRPESYYEDYTTASFFETDEDKRSIYADLKSGAESGWDFSVRWIVDADGGINGNLTSLQTRRIIPVDLNSFLCQAFKILGEFYTLLEDYQNAEFWFEKSSTWLKTIEEVLYNKEDGIWYDWDNKLGRHRKYFFPSNFAPLFAEAYDPLSADDLGGKAAEYLINQGIMDYQGGIPSSLTRSGEQWDYPNAWPPLQSIVVLGLYNSGNCKAKEVAKTLAERYINACMIGYNETSEMFEKYDAEVPGRYGGGGEYTIQSGFGWTNGVAFEFINKFFTTSDKKTKTKPKARSSAKRARRG